MNYYEYQGKKIAYQVDGDDDKQPLVLLNGIMMSMASWLPFLPNLTKHRKIIRIDMLDQGVSDKMDKAYTVEDQAKSIISLLESLNITKYDLFGISYGGHTALTVSSLDSERVDKLIVFNCLPNTTELLRDTGRAWNLAGQKNDPELYFHTTIPVIYSHKFYADNNKWILDRKPILLKVFNETFLQSMDRLVNSGESYDLRNKLDTIKANTLVVGASDDLLTPARYTQTIAEGISGAKYIEITNCGHASMYEKPNEFISILVGFLNHESVTIIQ